MIWSRMFSSRSKTSIILGRPFLKSGNASIDEEKGTIKLEVEGKHEEFNFHPMNAMSFYQVRILYEKGSNEIKHIEVLPYASERPDEQESS